MDIFTLEEEEYWKVLNVSPDTLKNLMKKDWHKILKEILTSHKKHLDVLGNFLRKDVSDLKDADNLREVCKTKEAVIVYALQKFLINKISILSDFISDIESNYKLTNKKDVLISLLELFSQNKEEIGNANFYCIAHKIPCLEELRSEQITLEFLNKFEKREGVSFVPIIKKELKNKARLSYQFSVGENFYFFYERAKENKVYEGYGSRISLLSKSNIILWFNVKNKSLKIITQDPRVSEVISEFSDRNAIYFETISPLEIEGNFSINFGRIFTEEIKGFEIKKIIFNRLGRNTLCKSTFEQGRDQQPLNKTLLSLIQQGFIDPANPLKFEYLTFALNGFEFRIKVSKEEDFVKLELKKESLAESKKEEIFNFFKKNFSIHLDASYYTKEISLQDKKNILCGLLGKYTTQFSRKEEVVYREVKKYDLFSNLKKPRYLCHSNPQHRIPEVGAEKCPICENSLLVKSPRERVELDEKKVLNFILKKMKEIYGNDAVNLKKVSNGKQIVYISNIKSNFIIYPYLSGSMKAQIKRWNEEGVPVVQVIMDKKAPMYEYDLSSQLFLYDFLYDDSKKIKNELDEVTLFRSEKILIEQCDKSLQVLKKIVDGKSIKELTGRKDEGDAFEEICFPLLRRTFIRIVHWGRTKKFKTIPDGAFGIKMSSFKSQAFSMLYDFKYSNGSYVLDKRQIRNYIQVANGSDAIKKFSGELSSFLIISHNLTDKKFSNLADHCYGHKKWKKGKCIKITAGNLIYLYEKIASIEDFSDNVKLAINLAFSNFIMKEKKERTIIISSSDIDEIFKKSKEIGKDLDINNLYGHLVKDEIFG